MALRILQLTTDADLELDISGRPTWVTGEKAFQQHVEHMLSLWLGTWFLDSSRGVDWIRVFRAEFSRAEIIANLTRALIRSPWILKVVDMSIKQEGHTLNIVYTVKGSKQTVSGVVPIGSTPVSGPTAYGEGAYGQGVYG